MPEVQRKGQKILLFYLVFSREIDLSDVDFQVFEAEKMTAKTGVYHKKCFTCAEVNFFKTILLCLLFCAKNKGKSRENL